MACCLRGLCQHLNLLSWKTCSLIYHLQFAQQLITSQRKGWGCVVFFPPFTRGTIITAYECVWMEYKCLLFGSAVQSQFNPGNDIGLPFSFSVCQNRFSLRGCRLWISVVITWYLFFQAALCSVTCPHRLLYSVCFLQCTSVRVRPISQVGGRWGSITLCPLLQTQEEGLAFFF